MNTLCDHLSHPSFSDGIFPYTSQDSYGAYDSDIKNAETRQICVLPTFPPDNSDLSTAKTSLLTQRLHTSSTSGLREFIQETVLSEDSAAASTLPEWKLAIISILEVWLDNIRCAVDSPLLSPEQKAGIMDDASMLMELTSQCLKSVVYAATIEQVRPSLEALSHLVSDHLLAIQALAAPPLVEDFEECRNWIWVETSLLMQELKEAGPTELLSDSFRKTILAFLNDCIEKSDQTKAQDAGNLSPEAAQKLMTELEKCRQYLLQAKESLGELQSNKQAYMMLGTLRKNIISCMTGKEFQAILNSPQRKHLKAHVYAIETNLTILQEILGDVPL